MVSMIKRARDRKGASLVEYALLVALIAVVCITAITVVGTNTRDLFNNVALTTSNLTIGNVSSSQSGSSVDVSFDIGSSAPTASIELAASVTQEFVAECNGDGGGFGEKTENLTVEPGNTYTITVDVNDGAQSYDCSVNGIGVGESFGGGGSDGVAATETQFSNFAAVLSGADEITVDFDVDITAGAPYTVTCGTESVVVPDADTSAVVTGLSAGTYSCTVDATAPDTGSFTDPGDVTIPIAWDYEQNFDGGTDTQASTYSEDGLTWFAVGGQIFHDNSGGGTHYSADDISPNPSFSSNYMYTNLGAAPTVIEIAYEKQENLWFNATGHGTTPAAGDKLYIASNGDTFINNVFIDSFASSLSGSAINIITWTDNGDGTRTVTAFNEQFPANGITFTYTATASGSYIVVHNGDVHDFRVDL